MSDIELGNTSPDNFLKRAGNRLAVSPEKQAQEHREATTLMVYYTSPADVPSSPKEPPQSDSEEPQSPMQSFGDLPDHIKVRLLRNSLIDLTLADSTGAPLRDRPTQIGAASAKPSEQYVECHGLPESHGPRNSNSSPSVHVTGTHGKP